MLFQASHQIIHAHRQIISTNKDIRHIMFILIFSHCKSLKQFQIYRNAMQSFPTYPIPGLLNQCCIFITINKPKLTQYNSLKSIRNFYSLTYFTLYPSSVPGSHLEYHSWQLADLLRFLSAVIISRTCLVFKDLYGFEKYWSGKYFGQCHYVFLD